MSEIQATFDCHINEFKVESLFVWSRRLFLPSRQQKAPAIEVYHKIAIFSDFFFRGFVVFASCRFFFQFFGWAAMRCSAQHAV